MLLSVNQTTVFWNVNYPRHCSRRASGLVLTGVSLFCLNEHRAAGTRTCRRLYGKMAQVYMLLGSRFPNRRNSDRAPPFSHISSKLPTSQRPKPSRNGQDQNACEGREQVIPLKIHHGVFVSGCVKENGREQRILHARSISLGSSPLI
jgi:hypothetical protein